MQREEGRPLFEVRLELQERGLAGKSRPMKRLGIILSERLERVCGLKRRSQGRVQVDSEWLTVKKDALRCQGGVGEERRGRTLLRLEKDGTDGFSYMEGGGGAENERSSLFSGGVRGSLICRQQREVGCWGGDVAGHARGGTGH